jgi:hypothetical protein
MQRVDVSFLIAQERFEGGGNLRLFFAITVGEHNVCGRKQQVVRVTSLEAVAFARS